MTSVAEATKLANVGGDFIISNLQNIIVIDGFPAMISIGGSLEITFVESVTRFIRGFNNLESIRGAFRIIGPNRLRSSTQLRALEGFASLQTIGLSLDFMFMR